MKRILLLFLLFQSALFSQKVTGVVIDENDALLGNVTVTNRDKRNVTFTNQKGEFTIKATKDDVLTFSYIGKKSISYSVKQNDTNIILIKLKKDIEKLKEFTVSSKRIKDVSIEYNENILDYLSLGKNTLLVLKRKKFDYQLCIEGIDTIYNTFSLDKIKPKELYIDFMGNIHLVCSDSIRQIHLENGVTFISTISKNKFTKFITPTIHKTDSTLFVESFSIYNKKYTLLKESGTRKSIIFQAFDSARADYNDYFVKQFLSGPKISSVGELTTKQLRQVRDLFQAEGFYGKILCKKLFVNTFLVGNTILIFDLFGDSLIAFKENGSKIYAKSIKSVKDLNPTEIIQDQENSKQFYAVTKENGVYSFHNINLLTGEPSLKLTLSELIFPENYKIIENWIYFIYPTKSGFHKLYRVKLNE